MGTKMLCYFFFTLLLMSFDTTVSAENLELTHAKTVNQAVFTREFAKNIMNARREISIEGSHGELYEAFLYAENEHKEPEMFTWCDGTTKKVPVLTGNYYIYLYKESTGIFVPSRIEVFKNTKMRMNIWGASFFTVYTSNENASDILLVSQPDCGGDYNYYEAYGLPKKNQFLQQYVFVMNNKKYKRFFGQIKKDNKIKKRTRVYGKYDDNTMKEMYLSLSDTPGEIQLELIEPTSKQNL